MSTPMQRPAAPAPVPPRQTSRTGKVVMLSGSAAVVVLAWAGAPWWAVTVVAVVGIVMPGVILLAQVVLPHDSEHKRDVMLAALRYWDRRADRKRKQREQRRRRGK
ncbi:hypothetical protein [Streptomyces sp. ID05-18]|uniref:hypothetical protein n=1 Tax=Streptomyces sp. ID05-18 TaxID=3028662 RepID=UPI0029BCAC80|nr:hypothetical protein [Streptomyces sp. ID05-18]MDX3490985.1 hypothetical protein [Streptomyces sp. ID05-18]